MVSTFLLISWSEERISTLSLFRSRRSCRAMVTVFIDRRRFDDTMRVSEASPLYRSCARRNDLASTWFGDSARVPSCSHD